MASGSSGFQWTWDDALKSFAGSNESVTTRTDVTTSGGTGVTSGANANANANTNSASAPTGSDWIQLNGGWHCYIYDPGNDPPVRHDVVYAVPFTMKNDLFGFEYNYFAVVACDLNWPQWMTGHPESTSDPFFKFMQQTGKILDALLGSPGKNDTTDPGSFDAAITMVGQVRSFLEYWAPQIKKWSDSLHVKGSDWQGSAAAEFKALLDGVGNEFADLLNMMAQPTDILSCLSADRDMLNGVLGDLRNIFTWWQNDAGDSWPLPCVKDALYTTMSGCGLTYPSNNIFVGLATYRPHFFFSTSNGLNPINQDFWYQLEANAKQLWLNSLQTNVDPIVSTTMNTLDQTYTSSIDALSMGLGQVSLTMPPAPNAGLNGPGGLNGLGGLGGGNLNSLLGPGGNGHVNLNSLLGSNSGANGSGGAEVILPNGKPFLDPKTHKPFQVPSGSTVNQSGQVLDAFGNPVIGPDGRPLKVPAGSTIKSDTPPTTQPGGNLNVPKGSKIQSNGHVVDPTGHPVPDANGNPIVLPHGARILPDGTVVDANGHPISATQQLLTDEQAALNPSASRPVTLPPAISTHLPTVGGIGLSGGAGSGPGSASASKFLSGTPTLSLSPSALQNNAALANSLGATQYGAAQAAAAQNALAAAEQAQLAGKGLTSASAPPYIPPMGGMGGMGSGGNPNEKDRQRTTWLSEDEEVWGTEIQGVEGVIGR